MKKHYRSRACAAIMIASVTVLSACQKDNESRGKLPDERNGQTPESLTPTESVAEPTTAASDPTPAAADPVYSGRIRLTDDEINNINSNISRVYNGFFTCSYCCPEMIDWGNVCYDGAGIDTLLSEEEMEDYLQGRELMTEITAIRQSDLEEYCRLTTGTEYSNAQRGIDWSYIYNDELIYVNEHGDTNYMGIQVTSGYKEGDIWHVFFNTLDTYAFKDRDFELTARVTGNGKVWNFISNMPENEPSQSKILNIDYYKEEADIPCDEHVNVEELPSDEPAWYWAQITAEEDDTLVVIDRADISGDNMMLIWEGIFLPGERLYSKILDKGESFAIRVNMAWTPVIHLSASRDGFEAEYSFGQDNWRHNEKDDGTPASNLIVGFDRDAMGCGLHPENNIEFLNMLDGGWVYLDENGQAIGYLLFNGYGNDIRISNFEEGIDAIINIKKLSTSSGIADGICVECGEDDLMNLNLPDIKTYSENTYEVETEQLKDGQLLRLTPTEKKDDIIHLIMSLSGGERQSLEFYRFNTCAE